jgi:myo-inositol-1(or 4)-monophosphatase
VAASQLVHRVLDLLLEALPAQVPLHPAHHVHPGQPHPLSLGHDLLLKLANVSYTEAKGKAAMSSTGASGSEYCAPALNNESSAVGAQKAVEVEDTYMEKALDIVKEAGFHVVEAFHKQRDGMDVGRRGRETEVVTEVDRKVEELIKTKLEFHFPTHEVIGEEAVSAADSMKVDWDEATPTWILDPMDGSTNFVHRLPFVSICLALTQHRQTLVAIVYNPITGDLYSARQGQGAYKNGFRLKTSHQTLLSKSLVMGSGGRHVLGSVEKKKVNQIYGHNLKETWKAGVHGVRWIGNPSLSICAVAEGAADLFLDFGLYCWNLAAPVLILQEAQGCVKDPGGGDFQLMGRRIAAAASPQLADALLALPLRHINFPSQTQTPTAP